MFLILNMNEMGRWTMVKFGPAGIEQSFYDRGLKSTAEIFPELKKMGLNAFEYQCGRGVNTGEKTAREIGKVAAENDIALSVHAPYYINMANPDAEKRANSTGYLLQTLKLAKHMGATRVISHIGSSSKISRKDAMGFALSTLKDSIQASDEGGYADITICPELMGKMNQLGDLDELTEMCLIDDRLVPCIDFGHYNARTMGGLSDVNEYRRILDVIEDKLGYDRLKMMHSHFSRIEFTSGGEKMHHNYDDTEFGPDFEPYAEQIVKRKLEPTIICESRDNMSRDSLTYKKILEEYKSK
jgi:deoxyribonuclease IV